MQLNAIDKKILEEVADLHDVPMGAYNIRKNGEGAGRNTTANIDIVTKKDKPGLDILVKPETKNESVHIPVILSQNLEDTVYNTFDIGEDSDVLVVAGCGIHNTGTAKSQHDGIHDFIVRKGAKMKYVEKHYGEGDGTGDRVLNPLTSIEIEEGATVEIEMVQIKGVDRTKRDTNVVLHKDARLIVTERLLTTGVQEAESNITVELKGENSTAQVITRSVAQGSSKQVFHLIMRGEEACRGHIQCDSIIMDKGQVSSIPEVAALHPEAELIHEATIGRIAGDQLTKLMTLGLTEEEAEDKILGGFLE